MYNIQLIKRIKYYLVIIIFIVRNQKVSFNKVYVKWNSCNLVDEK